MRWLRFNTQTDKSLEINLTPLIDVVFILLIFFMVSSSFENNSHVPIQRPQAQSGLAKADGLTVAITLSEQGELYVEGKLLEKRMLRNEMQNFANQYQAISVLLHVDKRVRSGELIDIIDQIRLAKISNIAVVTGEIK